MKNEFQQQHDIIICQTFRFLQKTFQHTATGTEPVRPFLSGKLMSGGQQQRCAAARAMVTRPALILADEPTGALDSKSSRMLLDRLETLNRERGATILMVTHDAFTASCCHRVVFLRDGQIFQELRREGEDRRTFFQKIIQVVTLLGGEMEDVL